MLAFVCPLKSIIYLKILFLTYKILNHQDSLYFKDLIVTSGDSKPLLLLQQLESILC